MTENNQEYEIELDDVVSNKNTLPKHDDLELMIEEPTVIGGHKEEIIGNPNQINGPILNKNVIAARRLVKDLNLLQERIRGDIKSIELRATVFKYFHNIYILLTVLISFTVTILAFYNTGEGTEDINLALIILSAIVTALASLYLKFDFGKTSAKKVYIAAKMKNLLVKTCTVTNKIEVDVQCSKKEMDVLKYTKMYVKFTKKLNKLNSKNSSMGLTNDNSISSSSSDDIY